MILDNYIT